jgi:hypothetical protein
MTDYVAFFRAKTELEGWKFFYGEKGFMNFETNSEDITDGSIVLLMFPARTTPQIEGGYWSRYQVQTQFWLCRKFEDTTHSAVNETELQKYEARLQELSDTLDAFLLTTFQCATNIEVKSIAYFRELNQFSVSIDGVTAETTFLSW